MKNLKIVYFIFGCIITALIIGCAPPSSQKDLTAFSFEKAHNETYISNDIKGVIKDTSIILVVPENTVRTNLIATFTITGSKIEVNSVQQKSGVTSNSYSSPVTYIVTAQDGSTKEYTVTVYDKVIQHGKKYNLSDVQTGASQICYKNEKPLLLDQYAFFDPSLFDMDALLIKNDIQSIGIGSDNIWLTSDDIADCVIMVSDTRYIKYDDFDKTIVKEYTDYTFNNGKLTKAIVYNQSGSNGIWFDSDDTILTCRKYEYDTEGKILQINIYWLDEVTLSYYFAYMYNTNNKIEKIYTHSNDGSITAVMEYNYTNDKLTNVKYYFSGDTMKLSQYAYLIYNPQGRLYKLDSYRDGGDGIISSDDYIEYSSINEYNEYGYISRSDVFSLYQTPSDFYQIYTYEFQ